MRNSITTSVLALAAGAIVLAIPVTSASAFEVREDRFLEASADVDREALGSLGGYVRDGDPNLGDEIEGAVVTLSDGQICFTNNHGYFEFQGIPVGNYVLSVEAECYESTAVSAYVEADTLNIKNVGLQRIAGCVEEPNGCNQPVRFVSPHDGPFSGAMPPGIALALLAGVVHFAIRRRR